MKIYLKNAINVGIENGIKNEKNELCLPRQRLAYTHHRQKIQIVRHWKRSLSLIFHGLAKPWPKNLAKPTNFICYILNMLPL